MQKIKIALNLNMISGTEKYESEPKKNRVVPDIRPFLISGIRIEN